MLTGKGMACDGARLVSLWSCTLVWLQESHDNRGQHEEMETAAYEARLFSEMLLKGAVNMFEVNQLCGGVSCGCECVMLFLYTSLFH